MMLRNSLELESMSYFRKNLRVQGGVLSNIQAVLLLKKTERNLNGLLAVVER